MNNSYDFDLSNWMDTDDTLGGPYLQTNILMIHFA